jgi:hypothetical protein
MPKRFENPVREVERAERRRRALQLREAGYTYAEIATALGWKQAKTAEVFVKRALRLTYQEPADRVRQLELNRLDRLMRGIWTRAIGRPASGNQPEVPPDLDAIDRVLKLMGRRARLLGLDVQNFNVTSQHIKEYTLTADPADIGKWPASQVPMPNGRGLASPGRN